MKGAMAERVPVPSEPSTPRVAPEAAAPQGTPPMAAPFGGGKGFGCAMPGQGPFMPTQFGPQAAPVQTGPMGPQIPMAAPISHPMPMMPPMPGPMMPPVQQAMPFLDPQWMAMAQMLQQPMMVNMGLAHAGQMGPGGASSQLGSSWAVPTTVGSQQSQAPKNFGVPMKAAAEKGKGAGRSQPKAKAGKGPSEPPSEYEYSYEEPEEETNTDDPSVRPSTQDAGSELPSERGRRPRSPLPRARGPEARRDDRRSRGRAEPAARPASVKSEVTEPRPASSAGHSGRTSELREMLKDQVRKTQDRNRPALSQIKIETFSGNRLKYRDWKKTLDAQRALYKLSDEELAILIYLSTSGEARDVLNQLEVQDMQEAGGLNRVMRLLDDAYGTRAEERFEDRQEAFHTHRRQPGTSIAAYLATLKRLKLEYLKEDNETVISDKAFAQRMLTRASLTKRERMDIFFAAGGRYDSKAIEKVMRFRCHQVHVEEKQQSYHRRPSYPKPRASYRPRPRHGAHLAEWDDEPFLEEDDPEEDEEALDNEDLEREAAYDAYYGEQDWSTWYESDDRWQDHGSQYGDGWYESEGWYEDDGYSVDELREAYAAGWSAKAQSAEHRKGRGYRVPSKGKGKGKGGKSRPPDTRTVDDRKRNSTCASCGQKGHWRGDPECPKVRSGEVPERTPGADHGTLFAAKEAAKPGTPTSPSPTSPEETRPAVQVSKVNGPSSPRSETRRLPLGLSPSPRLRLRRPALRQRPL